MAEIIDLYTVDREHTGKICLGTSSSPEKGEARGIYSIEQNDWRIIYETFLIIMAFMGGTNGPLLALLQMIIPVVPWLTIFG